MSSTSHRVSCDRELCPPDGVTDTARLVSRSAGAGGCSLPVPEPRWSLRRGGADRNYVIKCITALDGLEVVRRIQREGLGVCFCAITYGPLLGRLLVIGKPGRTKLILRSLALFPSFWRVHSAYVLMRERTLTVQGKKYWQIKSGLEPETFRSTKGRYRRSY